MNSSATATAGPGGSTPGRHRTEQDTTLKNLAKGLARDATAEITDRHLRAQIRTRCYNHVVNALQDLEARQAHERALHRRTLTVLGSVAAFLAVALAVSLTI